MGSGSKVQCMKCNDIIQSKHVHDMVTCKCGAISIDGGSEYGKLSGDFKNIFVIDKDKTLAELMQDQHLKEIKSVDYKDKCIKFLIDQNIDIQDFVIFEPSYLHALPFQNQIDEMIQNLILYHGYSLQLNLPSIKKD